MSLLTLCQGIQETWLSTAISQSTWAYPIIGAIHVLGIAWFGGAVLIKSEQLRAWRWIGLAVMLLTGALLFWSEPVKCYTSVFFRIKMLLLVLVAANASGQTKRAASLSVILWVAIIFAARGIAFL